MWEDLVRLPLGRTSMRKFMMLFATLLVAVLGYSLLTSTPVFAADGSWNSDDTLQYDGKKYQGPATSDQPQDVPSGAMWYGTYDSAKKKAWVVFFDPSLKNGEQFSATTAGLITYTYTDTNGTQPGGVVLSNPGQQVQISITPRAPPASNSTSQPASDCKIDGVGWLVCNASYWIAEGMDKIYELVESFLATKTLFGTNDAALRTWEFARNIANICFVIAFLVMIYGQITGGMVTNYTIRKVLPRLIIAAILVNVSYWVCVLFVDISNVLGYAVHDLFTAIREQVAGNAANGGDLSWQKLTAFILSGGTIGTIATIAATGGSITALSFLLVAALVASLFAVLVAFVILAARQAIILILVILSPLAFVAYILPNTEEWFTRWRKAFTTLLVFFPAFSVIFGGSQLAGNIIIQSANGSLGLVLLGLTVQVIPLFVTPILIRLSSGILSTVAGLANDRSKGVFDGAKNWARGNAELHKARAVRNGMNRIENGQRFRPTAFGARMAMGKTHRERMTSAYQAQAEASYERSRRGQRAYSETRIGEDQKASAKNHNEEMFQKRVAGYSSSTHRTAGARLREDNRYLGHRQTLQDSHAAHERADLYKGSMEAADEEHWKHALAHDTSLRAIRTGTHLAQGRAKLSEDAMTNADERALQTQINQQANLRNLKIQSDVDTAHAQFQAANVTAAGKARFQNEVIADRALRLMNVDTVRSEKEAATIENTLKQRAEANWERITSDASDPQFNAALRNMRLQETEASDSHKKAEAQWSKLVENIRAKGKDAPDIAADADKMVAGKIKQLGQDIAIEEHAINSAKVVQQGNLTSALQTDDVLRMRAGGVGGDTAAARVYAKARKDGVSEWFQDIENQRTAISEYNLNDLMKLYFQGTLKNGVAATEEQQLAAQQEILQVKGNNWAVQQLKDHIYERGMFYEDNPDSPDYGKYYNDRAKTQEITDPSEIERRRTEQQMFVDGLKKGKNKLAHVSGTDMANMEAGLFTTSSHDAILRDIRDAKYSPETFLNMDPDELSRIIEIVRHEDERNAMPERAKQNVLKAITDLQADPQLRNSIKGRERGLMNTIAAYLDPNDTRDDLEKESSYWANPDTLERVHEGDQNAEQFETPVRAPAVYRVGDINVYRNGAGPDGTLPPRP